MNPGTVYLVGAGPGDPELLTVRAARLLGEAEVVLHDRLVSPEVLGLVSRKARVIDVGKRHGAQATTQERIYRLMVHHARRGRTVLRLKGGDPMVFGRGGEELAYLAGRGIPTQVVPGVSSALGLPTLAGIPLTLRGLSRSFAVVTGHCRRHERPDWDRLAAVDTLVVLMGVGRRREIARALIEAGRPAGQPSVFIERGSSARERRVVATLAEVAGGAVAVEAPAVWVVGEVAGVGLRCGEESPGQGGCGVPLGEVGRPVDEESPPGGELLESRRQRCGSESGRPSGQHAEQRDDDPA